MQFTARRRDSKFTPVLKTLRFFLVTLNRVGGSLILFLVAAAVIFRYTHSKSSKFLGPPQASVVQRLGSEKKDQAHSCGCQHADYCSTLAPVGTFQSLIEQDVNSLEGAELIRAQRREKVRQMTADAWDAYAEHAWGYDELKPLSQKGKTSIGGLGTTIVESLTTLYIMNLTSRYERARAWVDESLDFSNISDFVSVYETTTRILGSLMSAYQLTGDDLYMQKAEDLGGRLSNAFNSINGIPYPLCLLGDTHRNITELPEDIQSTLKDGFSCYGESTTQTEAGGLSLEFRALGYHSLLPFIRELRCKADRAVQAVIEAGPTLLEEFVSSELASPTYRQATKATLEDEKRGESYLSKENSYYTKVIQVWHAAVNTIGGGPTVDTTATFSKPARAFYEYLVKAWRQGGSCESYLRYPLDAAMHMLLKKAIHETPTHDLYLRAFDDEAENDDMIVDQSMCYIPAMFHLAAQQKKVSERRIDQWHDVATGITKSCVNMYDRFPGYLGGESARYNGGIWITKGAFELQADLVESLFYMARSTGEERYQEIAWRILQNLELQCKVTTGGYTILEEKSAGSISQGDRMPSEFMGSTLKFLYLMFADNNILPLDKFVFNRAGHPLLVTPALGAINNCHSDFFR